MKPMIIAIIGNGFDLAHGLPTSYSNFLDFVKACQEYRSTKKCDAKYYDFCARHDGTPLFDEIINHINTNNCLLTYFIKTYKERCADGKSGWIDFESEISSIIQKLDVARKIYIEHIHEVYLNLPTDVYLIAKEFLTPGKTWTGKVDSVPEGFKDGRVDELLNGLNRLTRLLEIYLTEYVEKLEINVVVPEFTEVDVTHILSFNYTNTFQKRYNNQAECCYIHGKAENDSNVDDCCLVLGIDEYLNKEDRDNENYFVWFKKFYQRIFKETDSEYIDWLSTAKQTASRYGNIAPPNEVYIYGHSLDVTDKDIISKFILMMNSKTYIFYYSKEDLAKKIENLVKVIGEGELIKRTRGKQRTLFFVKTKRVIMW